jgi:hypothetical protein
MVVQFRDKLTIEDGGNSDPRMTLKGMSFTSQPRKLYQNRDQKRVIRAKWQKRNSTFNSWDSPVVTHLTTGQPI